MQDAAEKQGVQEEHQIEDLERMSQNSSSTKNESKWFVVIVI